MWLLIYRIKLLRRIVGGGGLGILHFGVSRGGGNRGDIGYAA